jgi:polyisoprenoid-binding protein YceI
MMPDPRFGDPDVKLCLLTWLAPPAVLASVLAVAPVAPAPGPAPDAPQAWSIDSVHSSVLFKVRHLGVSNFYGMFKEVGGTISLDADDVSESSVNLVIQAASVDSRSGKRDQHLSSPDFFSVKEFPTIEFKSTSVKAAGADGYDVAGKLTLHGVTKDLTVKVKRTGLVESEKGKAAGFETQVTIKRSDFGMDYGLQAGALGDEVEVTVSVEAHAD